MESHTHKPHMFDELVTNIGVFVSYFRKNSKTIIVRNENVLTTSRGGDSGGVTW